MTDHREERRSHPRTFVQVPIEIEPIHGSKARGTTVSISLRGVSAIVDRALHSSEPVWVRFPDRDDEGTSACAGAVVRSWCEGGSTHIVAVRFDEPMPTLPS
jgi:hypothetical protein